MQKWPYADLGYLSADYLRFPPNKNDGAQKREFLTVEAVFASENIVMFFDHYAREYRGKRTELDTYLEKLAADGWRLTATGRFDGKAYQFRRYHLRRTVE